MATWQYASIMSLLDIVIMNQTHGWVSICAMIASFIMDGIVSISLWKELS